MARYKKKKSKHAPVVNDKKNKSLPMPIENHAGDEKNLFKKIDRADLHQELKKSEDSIKISKDGASEELNPKNLKKSKSRLTDFSNLKSAIEKKNALAANTLPSQNLSAKNLSENASSQVQDSKSYQKKTTVKNSELESKNFSVEQKDPGSGETKNLLKESGSEADDAELFRTAVERISNQEINEKITSADARQQKKVSFQTKPSSGKPLQIKIDLHGLTVEEARLAIEKMMKDLELAGGVFQVTIVTGKGLHSEAGPVLASEIHSYVEERFRSRMLSIDSSPMETALGGIPLRGYFKVTVRW